jgi:hypothetical protein
MPNSDELALEQALSDAVAAESLLAAGSNRFEDARKGRIAESMQVLVDWNNGNLARTASTLGISPRTTKSICDGEQLPQLALLLRIIQTLEISPTALLYTEERIRPPSALPDSQASVEKPAKRARPRSFDTDSVRLSLLRILNDELSDPIPTSEVARQVTRDHSQLIRHFPDLCHAISERYKAFRERQRSERREHVEQEIRSAVCELAAEGVYPSDWQVQKLLDRPGALREPLARASHRAALEDLGFRLNLGHKDKPGKQNEA